VAIKVYWDNSAENISTLPYDNKSTFKIKLWNSIANRMYWPWPEISFVREVIFLGFPSILSGYTNTSLVFVWTTVARARPRDN